MVLLALPLADHLLIERDRGQFVPSRRRRMMANVRAGRLLKIPAEPSPELRIPGAAAQTRMVSKARIRLDSRKSMRSFKEIICGDISDFESHMPSHAVGLCRCAPCQRGRRGPAAASPIQGDLEEQHDRRFGWTVNLRGRPSCV
jgi:hypothetical protein